MQLSPLAMHKSPHHLLHLHPREGGKGVKRRKIPPCNFPRLQSTNLLETNACSPHTHQVVKFHATRRSGPQRLANEVVNMIRPSGSRTFFRLQCQVREMKNEKGKKRFVPGSRALRSAGLTDVKASSTEEGAGGANRTSAHPAARRLER